MCSFRPAWGRRAESRVISQSSPKKDRSPQRENTAAGALTGPNEKGRLPSKRGGGVGPGGGLAAGPLERLSPPLSLFFSCVSKIRSGGLGPAKKEQPRKRTHAEKQSRKTENPATPMHGSRCARAPLLFLSGLFFSYARSSSVLYGVCAEHDAILRTS